MADADVAITAGSGTKVDTRTVGAGVDEHRQVVCIGDPVTAANVANVSSLGALKVDVETEYAPTYQWIVPSTAVGASKVFLDLFNASASGKVLKIYSITPIVDTDVAVVGALGIRIVVMKTSTVGTGGTAWVTDGGLDVAGGAMSALDSNNAAVPAQITGRHLSTAGATEGAWLRGAYLMGEEASTSFAYAFQGQVNMAETPEGTQKLTIREGQGFKIKQGAVASVGNVRFRIVFTLE